MVWVGETRVISTVSAEEILRSVQMGGEAVPTLIGLLFLSWQNSISSIFGVGIEESRLLVSSARRRLSLSGSLAKELRGGRVLLLYGLQRVSELGDGVFFFFLWMVRSWRRAGMEATAIPMFCSRL